MKVLRHKYGQCTGDFARTWTKNGFRLMCDECEARYYDMPSTRIAMASENFAGAILSALAAEGALILAEK